MGLSEELFDRAVKVIPGGVNSPVRAYGAIGIAPRFIDRADGCHIYDVDGKEYVDYIDSWGPMILGHNFPEVKESVLKACEKGLSFGCATAIEVEMAEFICDHIPHVDMVRMVNSGTEAVMSAVRVARGFTGKNKIIKFAGCYHGHSDAMLVSAGSGVMTSGVPDSVGVPKGCTEDTMTAVYNDLDSVKALVTDKTCAIILEPLQGEGGIYLATHQIMKAIRNHSDEEGILMICDEVQCGMVRTGSMFTWQSYGIRPDIMSMAKAIGSGIPVGAFAMTEEIAKYSLEPGDHGTTYGGNPLACTAVSKTIEIFEKKNLVAHVQELGAYLTEKLEELKSECDCVKAVKGKGLMQGIQVTKPLSEITKEALKEGLLIIGAGNDVIRFVPPLIIEKEHVDEMIRILKKVL